MCDRSRLARPLAAAVICLAVAGCASTHSPRTSGQIPAALLREARPIGNGPEFHPPATGPVLGICARSLGHRFGVHVEVFGANRVVIVPAAIGTRPPLRLPDGRISSASCYGDLVTLEPTGVVLVRPGRKLVLADLFRSWGQPLSATRVASFRARAGQRVRVFVDGRPFPGPPGTVPLARHAEIVLEAGPYVPPHPSYTFPPGT